MFCVRGRLSRSASGRFVLADSVSYIAVC